MNPPHLYHTMAIFDLEFCKSYIMAKSSYSNPLGMVDILPDQTPPGEH